MSKANSRRNSRTNVRVLCGAPARADGPRGPIRGLCRNLSRGGMFWSGPLFPVGKSLELSIELPQVGRVQALGEVRYHHAYPDGAGVGVRFTRIAQDDLTKIYAYVEAIAA